MRGNGTGDRRVRWEEYGSEGGPAVDWWWMICRSGAGGVEALTLPCFGGRALALFGHEEEAGLFLRSLGVEASDVGWRVRESRCGEVASVLYGPCANVQRVVLDPPQAMSAGWTLALASVHRGDFLARLLARDDAGQGAGRRTLENPAGTHRALRAAFLVTEGAARRVALRGGPWMTRGERKL